MADIAIMEQEAGEQHYPYYYIITDHHITVWIGIGTGDPDAEGMS